MRFRPLCTIFSVALLALLCSSSWAVDIVNEDLAVSPTGGTESAYFSQTSLSGSTAIFGSTWQEYAEGVDSGAVYIYDKVGTDWTYSSTLGPNGSDVAGIHYGEACVIDGNTIVVGAPQYRTGGETLGAIYIYDRGVDNVWSEVAAITCPTGEVGTLFGGNIALDGDNLIVGASTATATVGDVAYNDGGQAFVFNRNEGGEGNWGLVTTLTGSATAATNANFGSGVAIDGNLITVGAWHDEVGGNAYAGEAYVFEFDGADWNEVATLNQNAVANSKFGTSVAIDGDYVVVGASEEDTKGVSAGAAYVYARDEGGVNEWGQVAKLVGSNTVTADMFGFDCAIDDGVVAVGAFRANGNGTDQGIAYTFENESGSWSETALFVACDASNLDMLGYSIDLEGNQLVATALRGDGDAKDSGEGYFFTVDGTVEPPKVPGDANDDGKVDGSDVTILAGNWQVLSGATWSMGDFNGDGKVDGSDVTILAGNWQYGTASAASAVPEPSTILLILSVISTVALIRRRK